MTFHDWLPMLTLCFLDNCDIYLVKNIMSPGQSWGQMARLSASGTAPEESDDDENSACGSGGG